MASGWLHLALHLIVSSFVACSQGAQTKLHSWGCQHHHDKKLQVPSLCSCPRDGAFPLVVPRLAASKGCRSWILGLVLEVISI